MIYAVVALADDHVKMRLVGLLGIANTLLQNLLGLLNILTVEVDGVATISADSIVLPEDILRSLLVVCVCLSGVFLALLAEAMCFCPISPLVGLLGFARQAMVLVLLPTS